MARKRRRSEEYTGQYAEERDTDWRNLVSKGIVDVLMGTACTNMGQDFFISTISGRYQINACPLSTVFASHVAYVALVAVSPTLA